MKEAIKKLLSIADKSYYNYKEQKRPIILLLEKYFIKKDLDEFLTTDKIKKMELIKDLSVEELEDKLSNIDKYDRDQRVKEIFLLINKYTTDKLTEILNSSLIQFKIDPIDNYDLNSFIKKLKNLLENCQDENIYDLSIKSFNQEVHFDFNVNDIPILLHILVRFDIYNNLYTPEDNNTLSDIFIDNTIYTLRDKMKKITDDNLTELIYNYFSKKILIRVLENNAHKNKNTTILESKDMLIEQINNENTLSILKYKKIVLIDYIIKRHLSNLECYVLMNYYEEVLNYENYFKFDSKFKKD